MPLAVVGASHRTAPLELRERLAFRRAEVGGALAGLIGSGAAAEAVLLSTCNRSEVYVGADDLQSAVEAAKRLLSARAAEGDLGGHLYVYRDRDAVAHLFRVTAGLDSMLLGEPQIQGQVREAYTAARSALGPAGSVVGPVLNRWFQSALAVGGRIRSETEIGRGAASVHSAAVELAKKIFVTLRGRRALVLGAGEMSEVTLECLRGEGVRTAVVANRTHERAVELAARLGGTAVRWDAFDAALPEVDIVVASTAAPHPVLTRERLRRALPDGAGRPLCILDIAVPRDVAPEVGDEPNVFLYNVDDLAAVVDDNRDRRRSELPTADAIIAETVEHFWSWYAALAVVPTIRSLRQQGERLRQAEVGRALRRLAHLSSDDQEAIDALTRALTNKLLHSPTVRLRDAVGNGRGTGVLDTARYLFELDDTFNEGDE
ncbi:glutamyl-tRNA reductase [soil metagenome]